MVRPTENHPTPIQSGLQRRHRNVFHLIWGGSVVALKLLGLNELIMALGLWSESRAELNEFICEYPDLWDIYLRGRGEGNLFELCTYRELPCIPYHLPTYVLIVRCSQPHFKTQLILSLNVSLRNVTVCFNTSETVIYRLPLLRHSQMLLRNTSATWMTWTLRRHSNVRTKSSLLRGQLSSPLLL